MMTSDILWSLFLCAACIVLLIAGEVQKRRDDFDK